MRRFRVACVAIVGFVVPEMWADEGRIPIFQPTTITQPGNYILTRDISANRGITIQASKVTLDLNGHTISNANPVIAIYGPYTDIRIHNGRLIGLGIGIEVVYGPTRGRLVVEDVEIVLGYIVVLDPEFLEVRSCRFLGGAEVGITVGTSSQPWTGRFVDNTILDTICEGINLEGLTGGEVRGNIVSRHGLASGTLCAGFSNEGIIISGGGGNRIEENKVSNGKTGIRIGSDGNLIVGNVVKGNLGASPGSGYGIDVSGARNVIEQNQVEGNSACGLQFSGSTNAYRNNMLRGNTGGAVCGTANTDAGGNIL